jgi:hypothetical protein
MLAAFIFRMMMEAASTCETMVNFYQTTQHDDPEDSYLKLFFSSLTLSLPGRFTWIC